VGQRQDGCAGDRQWAANDLGEGYLAGERIDGQPPDRNDEVRRNDLPFPRKPRRTEVPFCRTGDAIAPS